MIRSPWLPYFTFFAKIEFSVGTDTAKARTSYEDFFALWKDADPDIPILQQAKTE